MENWTGSVERHVERCASLILCDSLMLCFRIAPTSQRRSSCYNRKRKRDSQTLIKHASPEYHHTRRRFLPPLSYRRLSTTICIFATFGAAAATKFMDRCNAGESRPECRRHLCRRERIAGRLNVFTKYSLVGLKCILSMSRCLSWNEADQRCITRTAVSTCTCNSEGSWNYIYQDCRRDIRCCPQTSGTGKFC
jgi:hypothetical protein